MFYNILTTSINNTHIKWKNSKILNTSRNNFLVSGARPFSKHSVKIIALRHCDPVIGQRPVDGSIKVKVGKLEEIAACDFLSQRTIMQYTFAALQLVQ
jgi:hypothetical protein